MTSLEVLLVIIFYPCRWNMSGGLELLKSIIPGKQENVETPHTTAEWEVLLSASPLPTPLPFPSNLGRSSDLPRDSIIRWESLRQWPKRWFLKNLDGAYYRSFIQPMELKASLFLPACLCYTSSNQQHTRFPLPSPPLPILLDIGRQTYTIRNAIKEILCMLLDWNYRFLLLACLVTCVYVLIVVRYPVCLDRMIPSLDGAVFSGCGDYT